MDIYYPKLLYVVQLCPSYVDVTNVFQLERSKVRSLFMRIQNSENIDYRSAIRQQGSV